MTAAARATQGDPVDPRPQAAPAVDAPPARLLPCFVCLRRTWLIAALAGRIEQARKSNASRIPLLLALGDEALMQAVGEDGDVVVRYRCFDRALAVAAIEEAGLTAVCRHDPRYPIALRALPDAPAILHVAGSVARFVELTAAEQPAVAIVGARRASPYGIAVGHGLGRGLAAADVTVVSGMALGIDSAAHVGALEVSGPTLAVLAASADRAYPSSKAHVYRSIRETGCVISELPPGTGARRWCFPARNRLIAALARVTVVVEGMERSGSLITADFARDLGRDVGAVPGQVTSPLAAGPNALIADGAHVIRGPEDALDLACGVGEWQRRRPADAVVPSHLRALHAAVAQGAATPEGLGRHGFSITAALAGLAELELLGFVRRAIGGRYVVTL
jgi:DNA processing protein